MLYNIRIRQKSQKSGSIAFFINLFYINVPNFIVLAQNSKKILNLKKKSYVRLASKLGISGAEVNIVIYIIHQLLDVTEKVPLE